METAYCKAGNTSGVKWKEIRIRLLRRQRKQQTTNPGNQTVNKIAKARLVSQTLGKNSYLIQCINLVDYFYSRCYMYNV